MMRTSYAPGEFSSAPAGTHIVAAHNGVVVLERETLLHGMYARAGVDLAITTPEGERFLIKGFFVVDAPPALSDGGVTQISAAAAAAFAGPVTINQYAQAGGAASKAAIGQVRSLSGSATVTHVNGTTVVTCPVFSAEI